MSNPGERGARVEAEIAAPLRAARPAIDDLHRARLTSAIDATLDAEDHARRTGRRGTAHGARAAQGRRRGIVVGAAAAAVALAVAFYPSRTRVPVPQPPAPAAVAAPASVPPSLLRPYQEPGRAGAAQAAPPSTSLVALRGERARATIGTRVRLTLVGAGRVSVLATPRDGDIELALDGGRLLVDYDGRAGGTLRVHSPGAITTVVGTLFAVDVMGAGSRIAVAHGRVLAEDPSGRGAQISAGSSWTSADGWPAPIPHDLAAALAQHETDWAPPVSAAAPHPSPLPALRGEGTRRARTGADLDALYAKAEAAMRERSLGEARRALETIAARDPRGPLGEAALLDLARLALADGDRAEARRALARLRSPMRDPALAETAAHLRCRARASVGDSASACDASSP